MGKGKIGRGKEVRYLMNNKKGGQVRKKDERKAEVR
jgi:hypothetical protein